jgi:hypothetical protein
MLDKRMFSQPLSHSIIRRPVMHLSVIRLSLQQPQPAVKDWIAKRSAAKPSRRTERTEAESYFLLGSTTAAGLF